jgi:hypothetical protein
MTTGMANGSFKETGSGRLAKPRPELQEPDAALHVAPEAVAEKPVKLVQDK